MFVTGRRGAVPYRKMFVLSVEVRFDKRLCFIALSVGFAATSPKGRGFCVVTVNKKLRMNLYIVTKNIPSYPKILTNKQIGATLNLEDHPINTTEARL